MPATPPPSRPRLVRPDEPSPPPAEPSRARPPRGRGWLLALALAATLVAAAGWGSSSRRVAALEARVAELGGALTAARAEIAARQLHLEALRGAAADVEARVTALRALAAQTPAAPAEPPGAAPPGAD
jgi:hypothetical protein